MIIEKLEKVNCLTELYDIKLTEEDITLLANEKPLDTIIPSVLSNFERKNFSKSDNVSEFFKLILEKEYEKVVYLLKEGLLNSLSVSHKKLLVPLILSQNQKLTNKKEKHLHFQLFSYLKTIPQLMDNESNQVFYKELINTLYLVFSSQQNITNNANVLMSFLKDNKELYRKLISEDESKKLLWIVYSNNREMPDRIDILSEELKNSLLSMFGKKDILKVLYEAVGYVINHSCSGMDKDKFFNFFKEMSSRYEFSDEEFKGMIKHLEGVHDYSMADKIKEFNANHTKDILMKACTNKNNSESIRKRI